MLSKYIDWCGGGCFEFVIRCSKKVIPCQINQYDTVSDSNRVSIPLRYEQYNRGVGQCFRFCAFMCFFSCHISSVYVRAFQEKCSN